MLADVAEMLRSALPAINWEAETESHLSALLSRGTFVCDGICESIEISLIFMFTTPSVCSRAMARIETFLAPTAYEDAGSVMSKAPLMLTGLLCRMILPLLSSGSCLHDRSAWVKHTSKTYMMMASLTSSFSEASD